MLKSLLPEHLRKDWLLHFSGFLTWSLISYLYLNTLPLDFEFALKGTALLVFYISFAVVVTCESGANPIRDKALLALQIILVLGLIRFDRYDIAAILLVLVATQLPSILSRSKAITLILIVSAAHFFIEFNGQFFEALFHSMIYFMLQIFGFSAIESTVREARAKEELSAINQELVATRFMLKESSQRKERLRISRDLHDVIGHQLTALALNLEVTSHKVPDEFKPLIKQNLVHAKTLLTDVREVVKEMRSEEQFDLVEKLRDLITQLPKCQLNIESAPVIHSLTLKQQLMYCLQEGVSNAIRHGKANDFTLSFSQTEKLLTLCLADNGSAKVDNHSGSGLIGMTERLVDFNGQVRLIPSIAGCRLQIQVEDNYD